MKTTNLTNDIPELLQLISLNKHITKLEALQTILTTVQSQLRANILEQLSNYENKNNTYLGDQLLVKHKNKHYLIQGLTDEETPPLKVIQLEHRIEIKDKQTKGTEGEKA